MPLLVLVITALAAAAIVATAGHRYPRSHATPPAQATARAAGRALGRRGLARRLDPATATGFALSLALVVIVAGGLVLAVLALLVRSDSGLVRLDDSVARWGAEHRTGFSTDVLEAVTHVGEPTVVAVLATVLAIAETVRTRSRWVIPFVAVVVAGNGIVTTTIKHLFDRVRPEFDPVAATLGPSFPSGHSSWSAAFFAAAALLLSRGRPHGTRVAIAAVAAACAVTIAATRVLLSVHWLSDVLAGLAVGAAWFAVCAVAFGGRLLRFGAAAEEARAAAAPPRAARGLRGPAG